MAKSFQSGESENKHGAFKFNPACNLFVKDTLPIVFHLPPGSTKKKIAPIIKKYGGEITSKRLRNTICLADEKLWASRDLLRYSDCYWPTYIMDCVKKKTLLDIEQYKCSKGTRLMHRLPPANDNDQDEKSDEEDDEMWSVDDGMAPAKTFIKVPVVKKGRIKYTKAEDLKILKYVIDNHLYDKTKGIAMWHTLAKLQIVPHSAQSMMTRYRDVISKQLDKYNIPDSWKSRLTGDLQHACAGRTQHDDENETELDKQIARVLVSNPSDKEDHTPDNQPSKVVSYVEFEDSSASDGYEDDFDRSLLKKVSNKPADGKVTVIAETANKSSDCCGPQSELIMIQDKSENKRTKQAKKRCVDVEERDFETASHISGSISEEEISQSLLDINLLRKELSRRKERKEGSDSDEVKKCKVYRPHKRVLLSDSEEDSPGAESPQTEKSKEYHKHDLTKQNPQRSDTRRIDDFIPSSGSSLEAGQRRSPRKKKLFSTDDSPSILKTGGGSAPKQKTGLAQEAQYQEMSKRKKTSCTEVKSFVNNSDTKEADKEKRKKKNHKGMADGDVVKALSAEFGLTLKQTRTMLMRHSGWAEATYYWLMTGRCFPGYHYWTPRMDKVLLTRAPDHEDWQKLEEHYGLAAVLDRIHWLQGTD